PRVLLKGGVLATLDPVSVGSGDLRIGEGRIVERGGGLMPALGEETVDLQGRLVLPGLVNAHTHLYSALARGMPGPAVPPRNFVDVLERVWWRLDRALDEESVYLSALVGGMEAALSGTTLLVDHHSSPSFIRGSLAVIRRALEEVGLRSLLCYEVTDRNGTAGREEGLQENREFAGQATALTASMIGAHASFTLSDEALAALGRTVAETGRALHIHVAEDQADVEDCRRTHGASLPERLQRHALLAHALLAHCVHLRPEEVGAVHAQGAWIAHNPRSNMNNHVGYAPTASLRRAALGTDGMDEDMLAEARAAFLKMRDHGRGDALPATLELLAGGHRLAAALLGLPFGKLEAGGPADLVVLDYVPPTPIDAANLGGHLLFGIDRSHVEAVLVAGRWVVRGRRLATVDAAAACARAREAARALWGRMAAL
ncbi:MAG TPA: amidohydrolase family protein, partial [Vicinamibacteria bacterium]|nr:amidohydrolase family protein [Vicinamibacteria bacterium]